MRWSFKIGKLFGIDVFVHFTFLLLLGFIGLSHWLKTRELADAMAGVVAGGVGSNNETGRLGMTGL
ncbi:MAG: hypothetical protein Q7V01_08930 [Vicinamibacterales bacterium]|nr:hypothetical protein [Vicinamibacterales bacterium]